MITVVALLTVEAACLGARHRHAATSSVPLHESSDCEPVHGHRPGHDEWRPRHIRDPRVHNPGAAAVAPIRCRSGGIAPTQHQGFVRVVPVACVSQVSSSEGTKYFWIL
jgi:hypothetical protein